MFNCEILGVSEKFLEIMKLIRNLKRFFNGVKIVSVKYVGRLEIVRYSNGDVESRYIK